jgi:hypothetical protein
MQFILKTFGTLAMLSMSTLLARADDIPNYPVEQWCKKVAGTAGGSEMIYSGCMDQEQDAYDALKQSWANVPDKTRAWCDQVAKSPGTGSYKLLQGCIDQEATAREENSKRRFNR